jgi:hypothetical protein
MWSAVAASGRVEEATLAQSSVNVAAVEECVLRVLRRLTFPRAAKPTNASFPFLFRAKQE